jgi:phenylalanyl-tRNA synthetase beta chain
VTYSAASESELSQLSPEENLGFVHQAPREAVLRLRNPIQAGRDLLRTSLVASLLEPLALNLKHAESVRLFEIAHLYLPNGADELPNEIDALSIALAGRREALGLAASREALDYTDLKGVVDELIERLALPVEVVAEPYPGLHPGRSAVLKVGDRIIGRLGELHPDTARWFGIEDHRVSVAEIELAAVAEVRSSARREIAVPRFLPVSQDFAVVVAEETAADAVQRAIASGSGPLAKQITLFDIYRGSQIGEGNKSMAFRVVFEAPDRALTDAELVKVRGKLERVLKQQVGGSLRS